MLFRVERDAFLYLTPSGADPSQFAQCGTCRDFTGTRCRILGRRTLVLSVDSCGLYVPGKPHLEDAGREVPAVTPKEAGFVRRQVRCQNCAFFKPGTGLGTCSLFALLNRTLPRVFSLDERVHPLACCNAQTPF